MLLTFHGQFASGPEVLSCWLTTPFKACQDGPEDSLSSLRLFLEDQSTLRYK